MNPLKMVLLCVVLALSASAAKANECDKKESKVADACTTLRAMRDGVETDPVVTISRIWRSMALAGVKDLAKIGTSEQELQALRDRFYQNMEKQAYANILRHTAGIKKSLADHEQFSPNIFNFLLTSVANHQEALFRQGKIYPETRTTTDRLALDMGLPIALPTR